MISVVAKSGRWSEAVELLQQAKQDGLEANKFCYTAAVSACAKGRNWRLALELVDEMRSEGLSPDHVTYGSAVSAMAKAGQWVRALSLLREMMEEGLAPNLLCYGAAIDACANGRQWQMAVELLDRMRQSGLEPDRICYNSAIHACAQSGQWERALSLANSMQEGAKEARPDAFTLNSVMAAMTSAGEWRRVLRLLDEMHTYGVEADLVSYNTAMRACNEAGQHQRTLEIFADLRSTDLQPDQESFSAATEACSADTSGGSGATAIELLRLARAQGLKPGARAVAAALAACVGGGYWREAVPTVEKMLRASAPRAWDNVMEFLTSARLESKGRTCRGRVEGGGIVAEDSAESPEANSPRQEVAVAGGERSTTAGVRLNGDCGGGTLRKRGRNVEGGERRTWGKVSYCGASLERAVAVNGARCDKGALMEGVETVDPEGSSHDTNPRIQRVTLVQPALLEQASCDKVHLAYSDGSSESNAVANGLVAEEAPLNRENTREAPRNEVNSPKRGEDSRSNISHAGAGADRGKSKAAREAAMAAGALRLGFAPALAHMRS